MSFNFNTYTFSKKAIGEGSFGVVVAGSSRNAPHSPVVGKFSKRADHESIQSLRRETKLLRLMNQVGIPHAVGFRDSGVMKGRRVLVMDRVCSKNNPKDVSNVRKLLKTSGVNAFDWEATVRFGKQILEFLAAMKVHQLVHRDLSSRNIGYNIDSGLVTVYDLGSGSLFTNHSTKKIVGTPRYIAPEMMFQQKKLDYGLDMWGFGVLLFEIYTGGYFPFGTEMRDVASQIILNLGLPSDEYLATCKYNRSFLTDYTKNKWKVDWKNMVIDAGKRRGDSAGRIVQILNLLEKIFRYEGRIEPHEALKQPLFESDVHLYLQSMGFAKGFFLSIANRIIPLSLKPKCIHIPKNEKGEYFIGIHRPGTYQSIFKEVLKPNSEIRIDVYPEGKPKMVVIHWADEINSEELLRKSSMQEDVLAKPIRVEERNEEEQQAPKENTYTLTRLAPGSCFI